MSYSTQAIIKSYYLNASKTEKDLEGRFQIESNLLSTLYVDRDKACRDVTYYESEIIRLEKLLRDAKFQAQAQKSNLDVLDSKIRTVRDRNVVSFVWYNFIPLCSLYF
jgi:hypothetical protein